MSLNSKESFSFLACLLKRPSVGLPQYESMGNYCYFLTALWNSFQQMTILQRARKQKSSFTPGKRNASEKAASGRQHCLWPLWVMRHAIWTLLWPFSVPEKCTFCVPSIFFSFIGPKEWLWTRKRWPTPKTLKKAKGGIHYCAFPVAPTPVETLHNGNGCFWICSWNQSFCSVERQKLTLK